MHRRLPMFEKSCREKKNTLNFRREFVSRKKKPFLGFWRARSIRGREKFNDGKSTKKILHTYWCTYPKWCGWGRTSTQPSCAEQKEVVGTDTYGFYFVVACYFSNARIFLLKCWSCHFGKKITRLMSWYKSYQAFIKLFQKWIYHGFSRVTIRPSGHVKRFQNVAGRVWSGQVSKRFFKSHGSVRVTTREKRSDPWKNPVEKPRFFIGRWHFFIECWHDVSEKKSALC